jgi:WXXGXW repeat (2 copies)
MGGNGAIPLMENRMKRVSKMLCAVLVSAAVILPAGAASARIFVGINLAPPPPQVEVRPNRPWGNGVWIDGHWARRYGQWVWIRGHWDRPYGHYSGWVPGHYDRHGDWIEGHWR